MPSAERIPDQKHAFKDALAKLGCSVPGADRLFALHSVRPSQPRLVAVVGATRPDRLPVPLTVGHDRPDDARRLVGERDRSDLGRAPCQQLHRPRSSAPSAGHRARVRPARVPNSAGSHTPRCRSDRARPSRRTAAPATASNVAASQPHRRDQRRAPGTRICYVQPDHHNLSHRSPPRSFRRSSRCSLGGEPSTASQAAIG